MTEEQEKQVLLALSDEKIDSFFASPIWALIVKMWSEGQEDALIELKNSSDVIGIHKAQGKLWVLDRDVALEEIVRKRIAEVRKEEEETEEKVES